MMARRGAPGGLNRERPVFVQTVLGWVRATRIIARELILRARQREFPSNHSDPRNQRLRVRVRGEKDGVERGTVGALNRSSLRELVSLDVALRVFHLLNANRGTFHKVTPGDVQIIQATMGHYEVQSICE